MAIIDISRELFSSPVYPGDPAPSFGQIRRIDQGDSCNLTAFYSGSHSATHLDAPLHFVGGGETIDRFPLFVRGLEAALTRAVLITED